MSIREITPKERGFLIVNSHPTGCATVVERMWEEIPPRQDGKAPVVLLLGASAGYGLAILMAGLRQQGIRGVGVAYEAPESERRTASAGWYRAAAAAGLAAENGNDFVFVNADAFSTEAKAEVLDLLATKYGQVDYLIYSLAAPRRTDPATGTVHHSVIKPLGQPYEAPSLEFTDGTARIGSVRLEAASADEREATVQVMGGADWQIWVEKLSQRGLLADDFTTAALSYVGSELTAQVYRQGTIGAAKEHLEQTATALNSTALANGAGRAFTVVAGAAVTQASTAIPSIALYTSFLRAVLGSDGFQSTVQQATALWDQLTGSAPLVMDDQGRIRLDSWEMDEKVQDAVRELWRDPESGLAAGSEGAQWFLAQVRELYGWGLDGVDYSQPVETTVPWPTA
ncbi:enoyl-[acyl-carrier-protein] reductase FabV [Kitasatospora sp. GP82]|uniref:enoyl-[acyl-carrier-protein] reductase FabV n=1 Tax=Kitasatospora sp. GP82 TaxID=3035089 RepID=UPI00247334C0|nr:enoyl-[acyl-carrier-protein] reductase FabV [Kitasatospora sp. GP82]MDH6127039.1 enoyl-[acyl-carrier protein] reductase/trans-2-enoyl-CoA reductase (NAD+) [Kitasatospora sp. GP82]